MEPTTNKNKIYILIVVILAIIVAALILLRKTEAPVNTTEINGPQTSLITASEAKQFTSDINSATTSDNEESLKVIDSQF